MKDNGVGISKDDLPYLLRPFSSDKEISTETIGEKGVGLTFALLVVTYLKLKQVIKMEVVKPLLKTH